MKRWRIVLLTGVLLLLFPVLALAAGNAGKETKGDILSLFRDTKLQSGVHGYVVSLFGNLDIDQPVEGGVTTVFGDITVRAAVKGRVTAVFGHVTFEESGEASGSVISIGEMRSSGKIGGDAIVVLGDATIGGTVSGNLVNVLGNSNLTGRASIGGDLVTVGSVKKSPTAMIGGNETSFEIGFMSFFSTATIALMIVFSIFVLSLGLPLLLILKDRTGALWSSFGENIWKRLLIGLCGFLLSTLITLLLFFTVLLPLLYFLLLVLAETVAAIYIGRMLFSIGQNIFLSFIAGFFSITLLKAVLIFLIPQFGFIAGGLLYLLAVLLVNSAGIGILFDTRFGTKTS